MTIGIVLVALLAGELTVRRAARHIEVSLAPHNSPRAALGSDPSFPVPQSILNNDVFPFNVPKLAQTLLGMPRLTPSVAEGART